MNSAESVETQIDALLSAPTHLIGVRHHSPSLARVLPTLLEDAAPDAIVLEAPPELADWLEWLAHPEAVAPLAFAVIRADGRLGFYPFADFSPELVTVRWAAARGVPVLCGDLSPAADPTGEPTSASPEPVDTGLADALYSAARARHRDDVWDRLVEVPGTGATPSQLRRSALAFGWAYRTGDHLDTHTAAREAMMRTAIRRARTEHGPRVVAVTGAWHSPALADDPDETAEADGALLAGWDMGERTSCLVPWSAAQLDTRSGYPAGIRDPQWQTEVLHHGDDPAALADRATALLTRMAAGIRAEGFPAGPGESAEAARMARDLAAIRDLPAPGRGELVEACTTVFAHGDVLGRGRMVARVAEGVLVGTGSGRLAPGTPRSGLAATFTDDVHRLGLPGPGEPERELRLEPLRNDRSRELFLQRCAVARIVYAESLPTVGVGGAQSVTSGWRVRWTSSTEATLAAAGLVGVTIVQAATARLDAALVASDPPSPAMIVDRLAAAAQCGLADSFARWLTPADDLIGAAELEVLVTALDVLNAIADGLMPGVSEPGFEQLTTRIDTIRADVEQAAVTQVTGLTGSDRPTDADALAALVALVRGDLGIRLQSELRRLAVEGTPLIVGAAAAVLWRHSEDSVGPLAGIAERIRGAGGRDQQQALRQ